jgi:hypothetical protein
MTNPVDIEDLYRRAGALAALNQRDAAQAAYMAVIAQAPTHFGALNDLGTLLYNSDFRSAARLTYAEAVRRHPDNPVGRINLANALLADDQIDEARAHYEAALGADPQHPEAHQGMANLLLAIGDPKGADRHLRLSVRERGITALPYHGDGPPCRVLLLLSAAGGNVPTRFLLDEATYAVFSLPVEAWRDDLTLPPHDLVFNAVGDADLCAGALDAVDLILSRTDAPVVNPPDRIRLTGREAVAERLAGLPGVTAPRVVLVARETLKPAARRFGYPLLLRSPGFHTGKHFRRVAGPADLAEAAGALPGRALLMIEWLDARGADGRFRKYRAMMVGGNLYPLHLAISDDWKVHYFTADMADRADHRAEEAAFLEDMPRVIGAKAMLGLRAIARTLDLDYGGIDFGLSPDGEILLYEANATMVVNPPESDPRWDYRRAPVDSILGAVRSMLLSHARVNGG